ncbi:MAG: PQQ-binding-like beta-propeller repeat protein [candidate division WOR-3 bacterium]
MRRLQLLAACGASWLVLGNGCRPTPPATPVFVSTTAKVYRKAGALFSLTTTAPGNRDVAYVVDWGDGLIDTTLNWHSGDTVEVRHQWKNPGDYPVRAMAVLWGETGRASGWTEAVWTTVLDNGIPEVPQFTIPERVIPHGIALFRATTTDPDGDSVAFCFDFGDMVGGWSVLVPSGETVLDSHRYAAAGTVQVRCRAKDKNGSESEWSEPEVLVLSTEGAVLWVWQADGEHGVVSSPVVVLDENRETVYAGGDDGWFYGIDLATGQTRRSARQLIPGGGTFFDGQPSYCAATGHIIVGHQDGELYCFTPSLARVWHWPGYEHGDSMTYISWGTPAVVGNRLYVPRDNDSLYFFTDLGQTVRLERRRYIPRVGGAVVVDGDGGVIVAGRDGNLCRFTALLDSISWQVMTDTGIACGTLAVGTDGTVYCGSSTGRLYAVSPGGNIMWQKALGQHGLHVAVGKTALYAIGDSARLFRIELATGSVVWSTRLGVDGGTTPILAGNGYLYCACRDENWGDALYCVRQEDGEVLWVCHCSDYRPAASFARQGKMPYWKPSPTITSTGNIIVPGSDALYCVVGYPDGLLDTQASWPKWQHDVHNTGRLGNR